MSAIGAFEVSKLYERKLSSLIVKSFHRIRKCWINIFILMIVWLMVSRLKVINITLQPLLIRMLDNRSFTNHHLYRQSTQMFRHVNYEHKTLQKKYTYVDPKPMPIENVGQRGFKEFLNASLLKLKDNLLHLHNFKYIINEENTCKHKNILVLTVFHSAPQNARERNEIRKTSATFTHLGDQKLVTLFLLAKTKNSSLQVSILEESRRQRDIIQGQFVDHYRNLTYKNVMGIDWIMKYCNHTKFVLKADDDVLVNPYHLSTFLYNKWTMAGELVAEGLKFLYCSVYPHNRPRRDTGDKWFTPKSDYPYSTYPPHCEGFAYIMSTDVIEKFYKATEMVPFFWVDDVYATGFLAYVSGIKHISMKPQHGYSLMKDNIKERVIKNNIFYLSKELHQRKYWQLTWITIQNHTFYWI